MHIDPTDSRSPSRQIADDLRAQITAGVLAPGDQLPSERQLVETYGTAAQTARKAISLLKSDGLAEGERGRGVFVKRPKPMVRVGSDRYARHLRTGGQAPFQAEVESMGLEWRQEILELAEVPAPDWVAQWFEIPAGSRVFVRRRRTWIETMPTQLADSYYELDTVAGTRLLEEHTGPGGGYARLEEAGFKLTRFREELETAMPTPSEVKALQLRPGVPVVHLHRIAFSTKEGDAERPVEVFEAVMAGDSHKFAYEFPAPE
ncbi:GntR family transcriptional regulator [Streptacidiphilus sp. 4-A2]|nr:GntR family transcriptional regulator [Streptacidiphilus sp. 4-A2]